MKLAVLVAALALAVAGGAAQAHRAGERDTAAGSGGPVEPGVAAVPFGPGERSVYRVTYGVLGKRGEARSEVVGVESVRGRPAYRLSFRLQGGVLGMNVNDHQESWLDVGQLYSHRFRQDLHQVRYERLRTLDFYPAEGLWRRQENDETGPLASSQPLDDVSFLYWARTLPLEVGRTYEFRRYYKESGNPVIIEVLRRETVTVPAGTFRTIVVRPRIRTSGLFADGGEAEVYFSDDERRVIVQLKTRLSIGRLSMQLDSYRPGGATGTVPGAAPQ
jgi:hypothetical protein